MNKDLVLGIDVGGQTTKCGVVDAEGNILAQSVIRSDEHTGAVEFADALAEALHILIAKAGATGRILGIGMGAPNGNYYSGVIENAPNVTWARNGRVPIAQMLQERMEGIPVILTNDANAAAVGEMRYGAARGMKDFIVITLGTGVGSGIVIGGKVVYGHDGFAGELGHTCAIRDGRLCGCGKKGCLEAYCSAIGAAKTAQEWLAESDEPSLLRGIDKINSKDIYDAACQGDNLAIRVLDYTGTLLGQKLADFIAFSAPEAIILFGGLARARKFLEEPVRRAMNDNVVSLWRNKVNLLFSPLKESDAAILGAAALAWDVK